MTVRAAAVAGLFYPERRAALEFELLTMLDAVDASGPVPRVLIAPHAGYVYSGPVAATGYARLREAREAIDRVVLVGPAHRVYFKGMALSRATHFRTPLGDVPVDIDAMEQLSEMPGVAYNDAAHRDEHSLEVHVPFLQHTLGEFSLVPIVVGDAERHAVATLYRRFWTEARTLIVVSTDLSHFLDYDTAKIEDARTTALIEQASPVLLPAQACGCRPVNGLLELLREERRAIETLDVRNSGDTAGDRSRVVGYGTYVVT